MGWFLEIYESAARNLLDVIAPGTTSTLPRLEIVCPETMRAADAVPLDAHFAFLRNLNETFLSTAFASYSSRRDHLEIFDGKKRTE